MKNMTIVNHEYYDLVLKFKPKFGNQEHINALKEIQDIKQLEDTYYQRGAEGSTPAIKKLAEEINRRKRNVVWQLRPKT